MAASIVCPACRASLSLSEHLVGKEVACRECGTTFTAQRPIDARLTKERRPTANFGGTTVDADVPEALPIAEQSRMPTWVPLVICASACLALFGVVTLGVAMYLLLREQPISQPAPVAMQPRPMVAEPAAPAPPAVAEKPAPAVTEKPAPAAAEKQAPGVQAAANKPPDQGGGGQPAAADANATVKLSNPQWTIAGLPGGLPGMPGGLPGRPPGLPGGIPGLARDFQVDYEFTNGQRPIGTFFTLKWKYADGNLGAANMSVLLERGTVQVKVIGIGPANRGSSIEIWMEQSDLPGGLGRGGKKVSNSVTLK